MKGPHSEHPEGSIQATEGQAGLEAIMEELPDGRSDAVVQAIHSHDTSHVKLL